MNDLERRVDLLEKKVKLLEETLETIKNMNLSEQMGSYIQSKSRAIKMVDLLNQMSEESEIDFEKEKSDYKRVQTAKTTVDQQIKEALQNTKSFSDNIPSNPDLFDYEMETGLITEAHPLGLDYLNNNQMIQCAELSCIVNKGLRITGYNGFETGSVVVPNEINGLPVVSIGEKAFKNASFSGVILPQSIKAILRNAFEGCGNLTHIDLPDGLIYLGEECFQNCGLQEFECPESLKVISKGCFHGCGDLNKVILENNISRLENSSFIHCGQLQMITLPESIESIGSLCFSNTGITRIVFPKRLKRVSNQAFGLTGYPDGRSITCAFLGSETEVESSHRGFEVFCEVTQIYCQPGSKIQKYAREHNIPIKPLSEFKLEDYQ